jgi:hypothetical protein
VTNVANGAVEDGIRHICLTRRRPSRIMKARLAVRVTASQR